MSFSALPPAPEASWSVELVRRIQQGDDAAFHDLYTHYRDRLLFAIRCRMGARLRAHLQSEDILQSVMRDALHDLHRFAPRGDAALARFLHTCALNKIRTRARRWNARRAGDDVELHEELIANDADQGALAYRDGAAWERLERALARLPAAMREVILLRQLEGLSNNAAAAALGKSSDATSKLFVRAMARLTAIVREAPL
jgi:RNA polymerase sigma-70 factor (ECF subfamily)